MPVDSSYAAFYYPWLEVPDLATGGRQLVPPGGHVLGVYASTDEERGVFQAPANRTIEGALDLEFDLRDHELQAISLHGVNPIMRSPQGDIRIWGARTLSFDALWKYVNLRRLFIFLERSIYESTQWVVFERNDAKLWARLVHSIQLFLQRQWRDGALLGHTGKEAFFVTCDETVMTQDDVQNGRLICEIGIAAVRPAEFVIFRIFLTTSEAVNGAANRPKNAL